ncbi:MAG: uroporphyrinogen-III synthase [Methylovirgula sp.]
MLVLVTRPAAQALETLVKLAARGHEAVLSPVAVIAPTGANWPRGTIDVLVATSARAFEALQTAPEFPTPETKRLLPLFLVGEKTLEAARSAGFTGPALAAAEVKELASKLIAHLRSYNTALYLAGRERKPDLENTCVSAGFKLTLLETYAAEAAAWLNDEALAALDADAVDAVLHYSRRSAALFLELLEAAGFDPAVLRHIAISEDAAAPLRELDLPHVAVAAHPDEDSMLALLAAEGLA